MESELLVKSMDYYLLYGDDDITPVDLILDTFEEIIKKRDFNLLKSLLYGTKFKFNRLRQLKLVSEISHIIWKIEREER